MGFFDSMSGDGSGLFGLGGMSGMANPATGMFANAGIDPSAMRSYSLKRMLLGTGIGLLSQGPSLTPQSFGSNVGQAMGQGMTAAEQAQQDYIKNAMMAQNMKMQQQQMTIAQHGDQRAQGLYEPQLAGAKLSNLSTQQQMQIAQQGADQRNKLFAPQLEQQTNAAKTSGYELASKAAESAAMASAPPWARLDPKGYANLQEPQLVDLPYGQGKVWTTYDPSKQNQPIGANPGSGQMDINSIAPATLDQRGYVDPQSQQGVYEAMGGSKNPMAAAALQIARNERQFSPREASNYALQQMVHTLNPNWSNADYGNIQSIGKSFLGGGKNATKLDSAYAGTGHLDDAWRKVYMLPDTGVNAINQAYNYVTTGISRPDLAAADPALKLAGNESVKLSTGGAGTEDDRNSAKSAFHAAGTVPEREGAFKTVVGQGNEAVMSMFNDYRNAHNGSLKGFDPNVIGKRIAVTRELGNDSAPLEEAFKEVAGVPYEKALPQLMQNGTLNKIDAIDWKSIDGDKFRPLKKAAYAQINSGDPESAYQTLIKGGAKLLGDAPSDTQQSSPGGPMNIDGYSIKQVK